MKYELKSISIIKCISKCNVTRSLLSRITYRPKRTSLMSQYQFVYECLPSPFMFPNIHIRQHFWRYRFDWVIKLNKLAYIQKDLLHLLLRGLGEEFIMSSKGGSFYQIMIMQISFLGIFSSFTMLNILIIMRSYIEGFSYT